MNHTKKLHSQTTALSGYNNLMDPEGQMKAQTSIFHSDFILT